MNKIAVIGCTGSGKTVFSTKLASKLSIPLHTIDSVYYSGSWQKLSQEELRAKLIDIMKGDRWIIDGQYTKLIPLRLEYVDTLIFFDYPKRIALWRIFKRYFEQKKYGNEKGNKIYFPWHQIKLILKYPRIKIYEMLKTVSKDQRIIIFKKTKDAQEFLDTLS
jgi:adenylate kinase family enzyme